MNTDVPKVFISYSWTNDAHVNKVIELAQRLMNDGVDVVLDKWELKEGQDKYAFMERSVTDSTITKVLMICDKAYAEKANARQGGVGDETTVISPEIYAKATESKYIPIIFERDENGQEYLPAYLKSRIYFDLSDDEIYEVNYENLLRNLHNKPEHSKPKLGKMPEYLNEEAVNFTPLRATLKQLQILDGSNNKKMRYLIQQFNQNYVAILFDFAPDFIEDTFSEDLLRQIDATKPLRDLFIDFLEIVIAGEYDVATILGDLLEQSYNTLFSLKNRRNSWNDAEFEFGNFMVWEMCICSAAILLHHKCYEELRYILERTYFLKANHYDETGEPCSFIRFRPYLSYIENYITQTQEQRKITLSGDILSKREKLPLLTTKTIAGADVVLYQLTSVLCAENNRGFPWFPMLYVYWGRARFGKKQEIWSKMVSKRHCESLFPLFDVKTIDELISAIEKNADTKREIRHQSSWDCAPTILNSIQINDIATRP